MHWQAGRTAREIRGVKTAELTHLGVGFPAFHGSLSTEAGPKQ